MARHRLILGALLAASLHAGAPLAAPQEWLQRNADRDAAAFQSLDRDRDGRLTRAEVRGDIDMQARFNDFDVNRDDVIDGAELARYLGARYGVSLPAPTPPVTSPSPPTARTGASSPPR
jgi:hypothetical protein